MCFFWNANHLSKKPQTENAQPATSIMVRGDVVRECDDTILLEGFSKYAQVKDIRMIRNRHTGALRDFAFIEFFSLEDSAKVMNGIKKEPLMFKGQPVRVTYSKTKGDHSAVWHF